MPRHRWGLVTLSVCRDTLTVGDVMVMAVQECEHCGAVAVTNIVVGDDKPWRWYGSGPDDGPDDDAPPCTGSSYDRHRALGLCGNCNEPALPGLSTCERHRTHHAPGRHRRAVDAGLCARCGRTPPLEGSRVCAVCKDRRNAQAKRRKARLAEEGRCVSCGGANSTGTRRCEACRAKRRKAAATAPPVLAPVVAATADSLPDPGTPVPRKRICDECADLSHRRPRGGCPLCHEPYEAEQLERPSVIGFNAGALENDR